MITFKQLKRLTTSLPYWLVSTPAMAADNTSAFIQNPAVLAIGAGLIGLVAGLGIAKLRSQTQTPVQPATIPPLQALGNWPKSELDSPDVTTDSLIEECAHNIQATINADHVSYWSHNDAANLQNLILQQQWGNLLFSDDQTLREAEMPLLFQAIQDEVVTILQEPAHDIKCAELLPLSKLLGSAQTIAIAQIKNLGLFILVFDETELPSNSEESAYLQATARKLAHLLIYKDKLATINRLEQDEKKYRDLVEASADWHWETDKDHQFTYLSEHFHNITDIPDEYLIGKTRHDFTNYRDLPPKWQAHWDDLQHHRPIRNFHYDAVHLDRPMSVTISGRPFYDEDGNFQGYRGVGLDTTTSDTYKTRFEEGVNAFPNGFVMWDKNDKLVMWNKQMLDLFPPITPQVKSSLTYGEMLDICAQYDAITYPAPYSTELRDKLVSIHRECGSREVITSDGKHLLVHEHPTSEGGIVGIYTDITNIKSREHELIESNLLSDALSQCGNSLFHARNESFILSEVCRIIVDTVKFDAAWVVEFKTPGHLPDFLEVEHFRGLDASPMPFRPTPFLKQAFTQQKYLTMDDQGLRNTFPVFDDETLPAEQRSAALFPIFIDTKVAGFLCVATQQDNAFSEKYIALFKEMANDVGYGLNSLRSEQSKLIAEEALRESESRYRSLVDMSPDAILVLDENNKIVFANPESHMLFGSQTRNEILSHTFSNFLVEDIDLFENQQPVSDEEPAQTLSSVQLKRIDESIFEADITSRPVAYAGLETNLLIIRDVTERNRVNEQLAQTSKLATLGEMAAGITHELSQPLNIMRFAAEGSMLKIQKGAIEMDQIQKQFDLISMQSARMADIIDHMRIFSRKDTGTIETFDPTLVVRQSVDMVEAQYLAENIHVEVRYPGYYEMVKGRPIQLEQVVLNLINNARDAINTRKKSLPEDHRELMKIDVNMTFDQADHKINIAITDNGGGIPKDVLPKLFDPFFTTKEVGKGTGLGLSVSYGIIAAMGGNIQARNIHNGARFDLTLSTIEVQEVYRPNSTTPVVPQFDDDEDEEEDLDLDLNVDGYSVLVVDDEVYAAEAMMEYLFSHGFQVNMAGDGEEALELYDAEPCDVVVTDIRMPRMDGHTLIKHLKKRNPDLPIIVVTGHTGMDDVSPDDLSQQAFSILKKPVSLSNLATEVEKATKTLPDKR